MAEQLAELKAKLISAGMPESEVKKSISYIVDAIRAEQKKEPNKRPVSNNSEDQLQSLVLKFWNLGVLIDDTNAVITGRSMAMVTYHGYKNKILNTYPETEFDIQLVREGDDFSFSKESGKIQYSHKINDPFGTKPIIGAYVIFKNKRGEYLEALSQHDYEEMRKASKQTYLWDQWESEFWLKSVIKRACKRHFNDIVAEIDKVDNEDYGMREKGEPPVDQKAAAEEREKEVIEQIKVAESVDELKGVFLGSGLTANKKVIAAKDQRKLELVDAQIKADKKAKQEKEANEQPPTTTPAPANQG